MALIVSALVLESSGTSETNHDILRLAEYRFINEKIDNNRIPSKSRCWSSKFKTTLEASRHKIKQATSIKTIRS